MTEKKAFTYVLLRYRHDPLAGECANVGVVLYEPRSRFLGAKVRRTLGRLSKIFPDLNGEALRSTLRSIEVGIGRLAKHEAGDLATSSVDVSAFARRVLPDDDSSFIWGPVGSGLTPDAATEVEKLYARFVGRYDEETKASRDDAAVWRPVRERLVALQIADRLQPKTISSTVDSVEFEHAWKNGAWHCYQPVSFDLANGGNIREKAARWVGHMVSLRDSSEAFKTHFFVGAPSNPSLRPDYKQAIGMLGRSPTDIEIVEEADIDRLVRLIERDVSAEPADRGSRTD